MTAPKEAKPEAKAALFPVRLMWYHPKGEKGENLKGDNRIVQHDVKQPLAAIVTHVHGPHLVNLVVFDSNGEPKPRTLVPIVQEGSPHSPESPLPYAEWPTWDGKTEAHPKPAK